MNSVEKQELDNIEISQLREEIQMLKRALKASYRDYQELSQRHSRALKTLNMVKLVVRNDSGI